jgi:Mitochondrial pyruvate carriers
MMLLVPSTRLLPSAARRAAYESCGGSRLIYSARQVYPSRTLLYRRGAYYRKYSSSESKTSSSWWNSAELWGGFGALAGWGMSGAAIYDAYMQGPEIISLNMTGVLIVYSSLFARWAWVVKPQNLLLCSCHVTNVGAQLNQLRRALEYKIEQGQEAEVKDMASKAAVGGAVIAGSVLAGPALRSALSNANLGVVSTIAASPAGPFTVHFWAPMSKWFISGASFLDLHRPTDKVSLPQYTALTLTGFFFSRYALLVTPINYTLCSVNIALFLSSAWHLGRKVNADYVQPSGSPPSK